VYISLGSIPTADFKDMTFTSANTSSDYSGIALSGFSLTSSSGSDSVNVRDSLFFPGPNQVTGASMAPTVLLKGFGEEVFKNIFVQRRGFAFFAAQNGLSLDFDQGYENEGPITPNIMIGNTTNGFPGGWLRLKGIILDTPSGNVPTIANMSSTGGLNNLALAIEDGLSVKLSGTEFGLTTITGSNSVVIGGNRDIIQTLSNVNIYDGFYNTFQGLQQNNVQTGFGPNYSVFSSEVPPTAPTCTTVTAGPPFTPAGTYSYQYTAKYAPNSGQGLLSASSGNCTADGATQQIQVSIPNIIPGAIGYAVYSSGTTTAGQNGTFTSLLNSPIIFTHTGNLGTSFPQAPGGGPVGFESVSSSGTGLSWSTQADVCTGAFCAQETSTGLTANRTFTFPDASGTLCLTTTCGGGGGGGAWNLIANPTGNFGPTMYSGSTNFTSTFHYTGTGTLTSAFSWINDTAATSGTSQYSPQATLCGTAWHSAASASDCLTFQDQPGNGTDAAITFNFGHLGSSTGVVTSAFPGPVASGTTSNGGTLILPEGTAPSGYSTSAQDNCYADSTAHHVLCNDNAAGSLSQTRSPTSVTSGDLASYADSSGAVLADASILATNVVTSTATPAANQIAVFGGTSKVVTPTTTLPTAAVPAFTGGDCANTAGSLSLTCTAINGTTVPTNAAADQVLDTTASATGAWKSVPNCGSTSTALNYSTSTHAFGCQSITTGTNPPWDTITNPSGNESISMGNNTSTFTWGSATSTNDNFVITDTASNTGTGRLLFVHTAASSTMTPITITAGGTANGVTMDTTGRLKKTGTGSVLADALTGVGSSQLTDTAVLMRTSTANTLSGATPTINLSGITLPNNFKVPVIGSAAPTQNGAIDYDSSNDLIKASVASATNIIPTITGTTSPATNALAAWGASSTIAGVCTPSAAGDICYWNGSAWTRLAGNASGTTYLSENSSGVPSWTTNNIPLVASLTTTAASSDNVTITGMTGSGHCVLTATNSSAAAAIASVWISGKTTNQITVNHPVTASMTYDIFCTPN
jgi:hypothetical protein